MNKKRNRSVNWDEDEKQLLRFVLKDHVHVIQNKAIDTKTIKLKNKAWEEVYKKFNELNGRHRQIIQLKIQWKTMKLNALKRWKTYSTYQREANKPGLGAKAATPCDAAIENLLNPTKPLQENNLYDDDNLKPMTYVDVDNMCINDKINQDNQQIDRIEMDNDDNAQVDAQKYPPFVMPTNNEAITATVMNKRNGAIPAKTLKQKVMSNISEDSLISRKDHNDYVSSMVSHIKTLKEEEHRRRLQMAEEEHSIKIAIQIEKLKSATLEREILELKKMREEKNLPLT